MISGSSYNLSPTALDGKALHLLTLENKFKMENLQVIRLLPQLLWLENETAGTQQGSIFLEAESKDILL